jgi:hypothetical protein
LLNLKIAPITPVDPVFMVPFARDDKFVGREDILGQIEERLQVGHRVSLAGIGGVGYESFHPELPYHSQPVSNDKHQKISNRH